eukprot:gnl/Trimastix_PCT/280.p2 GENE.gnl/Trimastix_PCT/280~~gnl/Trimastix_PCT/280.p2  ORF type:complete len:153 (+),score=11.82 gnl/Trimastix_PCT/280:115-573(+)
MKHGPIHLLLCLFGVINIVVLDKSIVAFDIHTNHTPKTEETFLEIPLGCPARIKIDNKESLIRGSFSISPPTLFPPLNHPVATGIFNSQTPAISPKVTSVQMFNGVTGIPLRMHKNKCESLLDIEFVDASIPLKEIPKIAGICIEWEVSHVQ